MSLTRELKDPESQISRWVDTNFDIPAIIQVLTPQIESLAAIMPPGKLANYPWSTVGNAVEFRLRQSCEVDYYATSASLAMAEELSVFHDVLAVLWDKYKDDPWTRAENAWVVYFAGVLEGIYRSGNANELAKYTDALSRIQSSNDSVDFVTDMKKLRSGELSGIDADNYPILTEMINRMPVGSEVVDDIIQVSDAAMGSANFEVIRHSPLFVDNPVFSGGKWVGGADGDFLVGNTLFEVKTTVKPWNLLQSTVRQLIGYVALDTDDQYQIDEVVIFLPRQGGAELTLAMEQVFEVSKFDHRHQVQSSVKDALGGGSK
jgi:hypothetical protein